MLLSFTRAAALTAFLQANVLLFLVKRHLEANIATKMQVGTGVSLGR